jgi:hypothetical protein
VQGSALEVPAAATRLLAVAPAVPAEPACCVPLTIGPPAAEDSVPPSAVLPPRDQAPPSPRVGRPAFDEDDAPELPVRDCVEPAKAAAFVVVSVVAVVPPEGRLLELLSDLALLVPPLSLLRAPPWPPKLPIGPLPPALALSLESSSGVRLPQPMTIEAATSAQPVDRGGWSERRRCGCCGMVLMALATLDRETPFAIMPVSASRELQSRPAMAVGLRRRAFCRLYRPLAALPPCHARMHDLGVSLERFGTANAVDAPSKATLRPREPG